MADGPEVARTLSRFLESDIHHRARSHVLEHATLLEFQVSEVLAVRLASHLEAADELASEVYSRLPITVRLRMLRDAMSTTGADELWPFLLPVLERIVDLRNRYAHGFTSTDPSGRLEITSWNRGRQSTRRYEPEEIGWLAWQAMVARTELARLWAYFVPSEPRWHFDFDEMNELSG